MVTLNVKCLIVTAFTAPIAFKSHSIAFGKRITSYPSMKERLVDNYVYVDDERVVVDGKYLHIF